MWSKLIIKYQITLNSLYYCIHFVGISSVDHFDLDCTNIASLIWCPPLFYSDDIPQGSITIYHVYVKKQDGSIIADTNITDTFYQLPSNLTVDCNSYNVSVTAFIEQYNSHHKTITKENTGSKIILVIKLLTFYIRLYYWCTWTYNEIQQFYNTSTISHQSED